MAKGIYKRGQVYWIRYAGLDGKTVYESTKSTKFKDAEQKLIDRKKLISLGQQPEIKKIDNHSFKELSEEYRKWAERQRSYKSKLYLIRQLEESFGSLPLRRFNTMLIEQFQSERAKKGCRQLKNEAEPRGNKPATINRLLATIKHMFTKAVEWEMVEEEIAKKVRRVKLLEEKNGRLRYLSEEECETLIGACDKHLKPVVMTALRTGMRKEEILSLTWDHVDLQNGFILLQDTKNGERREIPISETLRQLFRSLPRRLDSKHLFCDPKTGERYKDVKHAFTSACRRAKIIDFHFHDLRHTFASHLVMAGADLTTVKDLLGHKTLAMTLRYAHLAPSHKVKAVDLLDKKLGQQGTIQKLYSVG